MPNYTIIPTLNSTNKAQTKTKFELKAYSNKQTKKKQKH